jgi:hypothetical protein
MPATFFGRERELSWLRGLFEQAATLQPDGKFSGPRMAVLTAETGYGKSRIVQELYLQLTNDPRWDPPEHDYWPPAFGDIGAQLRVNPDMKAHIAKGPPRFLWLGARWQPIDQRNVDTRCALPDLRSEFSVHLAMLERCKDSWLRMLDATKRAVRKDGIGEVISQAADQALPLGGLLLRIAKSAKKLVSDRSERERGHDGAHEEQNKDLVDELMDCFSGALHGKAATPVVVWLDDAQWIDSETKRWLQRLWREATAKRWPVLVVVTHWEREWRELRRKDETDSLAAFIGKPGVETLELKPAGHDALGQMAKQRLPGLTAPQLRLLLDKAGGNFLTMVENLADLAGEPMHFVDEDASKPLSQEGEDFVRTWESDRQKRVEQRFRALEPKVRNLLGWSSRLGVRFLHSVVTEFATRVANQPDANSLLEWCVDPGVILGAPTKHTREFRDRAFHFVAQKHFASYGKRHEGQLTEVLREQLAGWIGRSFGADGDPLDPDAGDVVPEDSALAMLLAGQHSELRDLLDMAIEVYALPEAPDWTDPHQVAALRAVHMAMRNDQKEKLWRRIRDYGQRFEGVDWAAVPTEALGIGARGGLSSSLAEAGLPFVSLSVRKSMVNALRSRKNLEDAAFDRRLWDALDDLGQSAFAIGDLGMAQVCFAEALGIAKARLETESTPEGRRDVSISLDNVAGIEQASGDLEAALAKYEESLAISRALADKLETPQSRRDVAVSLH